jgi:hypothetical protein
MERLKAMNEEDDAHIKFPSIYGGSTKYGGPTF